MPTTRPRPKPRKVAPFTGAWIEIGCGTTRWTRPGVAPFTGAWIEIGGRIYDRDDGFVAPFTGAWIEIGCKWITSNTSTCRSLHGSVD